VIDDPQVLESKTHLIGGQPEGQHSENPDIQLQCDALGEQAGRILGSVGQPARVARAVLVPVGDARLQAAGADSWAQRSASSRAIRTQSMTFCGFPPIVWLSCSAPPLAVEAGF
jgi:hypothetical protein